MTKGQNKAIAAAKSRKQQIRECIDAKGVDAARKLGAKLGLNDYTIGFYIKEHTGQKAPAKAPTEKKSPAPSVEKREEAAKTFQPFFDYPSRAAAERAARDRARLAGLKPHVYAIIEQGGKFALVPTGAGWRK